MRGQNARFGHVITAMVTPFDTNGAVDLARTAELARFLCNSGGSDALVINGTTGESPTTTLDEKLALVQAACEAVGPEKIIAGIGGNNTSEVVQVAKLSHEAGASALLAVAPYYNKPSQEGLYRHFRSAADATNLPVLLYNVPGRTITNIDAQTTARLARDAPTIVGTKEAPANMAQVAEITRTTPEDFDIYSGDDATILPTLALGGAGVISVVSHLIGPDLARMHTAWYAGDRDAALDLFVKTLPVTRAIFSAPSPAPLKWAMKQVGQPVGGVRLPLVELTPAEQEAVHRALRDYGLMTTS